MASLITQAEWARRRGFSRQYVGRLVQQGVVRLVSGKVDPSQADAALASVREPARPLRRRRRRTEADLNEPGREPEARGSADGFALPQGGDLPTLLLRTRIKSEVERAKLLEIKAKIEAGKYLDADEVRAAAFNRARIVRDALLGLPDRLAALLAVETDSAKVHALLSAEIHQVLEDLSGGPEGPA